MDWLSIIISLILTAVAYMALPLIKLLVNGGRFAKNRAHKIALWNSIVLGAIFCIATIAVSEDGTIWNGAPAVLYYWINRSILTDKDAEEYTPTEDQIQKSKKRKNIAFKILKGIGAFVLGIISSEMLLMIIFGDSIEGTTALLLTFLVTIPFFALYFWLFTRRDKKKAEESYSTTEESITTRTSASKASDKQIVQLLQAEAYIHIGKLAEATEILLKCNRFWIRNSNGCIGSGKDGVRHLGYYHIISWNLYVAFSRIKYKRGCDLLVSKMTQPETGPTCLGKLFVYPLVLLTRLATEKTYHNRDNIFSRRRVQ